MKCNRLHYFCLKKRLIKTAVILAVAWVALKIIEMIIKI